MAYWKLKEEQNDLRDYKFKQKFEEVNILDGINKVFNYRCIWSFTTFEKGKCLLKVDFASRNKTLRLTSGAYWLFEFS